MDKMKGKRVLVTGAGTGIGREVALEFAREGADVALHYSRSADGARGAAEEVEGMGRRAATFRADLANADAAKRLADEALEFLGGVDVLVNNAGITMNKPFEESTVEQFDLLYAVNVRAQFIITQRLLPALKAARGAVINMTSIHAFQGYPQHAIYAGTKGAIVAHTRELAIELALKGIRVNAIAPGTIEVENYYDVSADYDRDAVANLIPAGIVGLPIDIAKAAVFLASDDARFILGQTLVIDGGTTSWMPFADTFRKPNPSVMGKGYVPGI